MEGVPQPQEESNVEVFYTPERTEEIKKKIEEAQSFEDLYGAIREADLITTSLGIESAESIIGKIESIRDILRNPGGEEISFKLLRNDITRTYGIRDVVGRLLGLEK